MVDLPKVSIIVPVYNVEKYLKECLDSVVNQTFSEIEIICINDGSTDSSLSILNYYKKIDSRIIVIDKDNSGYGHSMNCGMKAATGDYIGIVESDDFIELNMFEVLYKTASKYDLDFVKSDYYRFSTSNNNEVEKKYIHLTENKKYYNKIIDPRKDIKVFNLDMMTWTGLYKRSLILDNNIKYNETPGASYQDNGFWHQTIYYARKVLFIDKAFYHYRQDNVNSSVNNRDKVFAGAIEYEYIYNILDNNQEIKNIFIKIYTYRKFNNYWYNYKRIAPKYKKQFLKKFSESFISSNEKGELDRNLFHKSQWNNLVQIMNDPEEFYYKDNPIPVVFATNNNYAPYLAVAINSLIENAAHQYPYYFIYIFHTNLTLENQQKLLLIDSRKKNITLKCVNVSNNILNDNLYSCHHFTQEMYYRILIPEILSQYEKVIYLDCDLIINRDVAELYEYDLANNVLGVVKNFNNHNSEKYIQSNLKIPTESYFNSGVLIFNNKEFERQNIKFKCFTILKQSPVFNYPDQDILNIACNGKVMYLKQNWNFTWHHLHMTDEKDKLFGTYAENYKEVKNDPYIVHFTSGIKPWSRPDKLFAHFFWRYARKTNFYEEIIFKYFNSMSQRCPDHSLEKKIKKRFFHRVKNKISRGVQCCRDHGIIYTIQHAFRRIGEKINR